VNDILRAAEEEAARLFQSNGAGVGPGAGAEMNGGASNASASASTQESSALQTSGPYKLGPPERPNIKHDNGFLDISAPREPTVADRLNLLKWRGMLEVSEAVRPDLVDANAAYRHFLDGNGSDRSFSYERYIESDSNGKIAFNNIIADSQKHVEALSNGREEFSITSKPYYINDTDARFPYPDTENWQKAIGGHTVWTSADVQAMGAGKDKTYTMNITLHVEDRYNFNPEAKDIATGIPDSNNGTFEITGLAHQYTNYSEVSRVVTWKEGEAQAAKITDIDTDRNRRPSDNRRLRNRL
jgi:hypothetical protein